MSKRYCILQVCALFFMSSLSAQSVGTLVEVVGGQIEGIKDISGVHIFKGIPFAAPPVGDFRWKAPQPVKPWDGIRSCKAFGPSPMQAKPSPFMFWSSEFLIPEEPISEDCLYLNVWTPAESTDDKIPVLVYIYGGGFRSGGSGCPIYDGMAMAQKDVIVVSLNYRVGIFGFFAHPELSAEAPYGASGNYGMLDMIAGLRWVQGNIKSFGGDPDNVTIAGQSAGSFGVNILTASPLASGLFHKAIGQSGASLYQSPRRPALDLKAAEEMGTGISPSIEELRAKPADELMGMNNALSWPFVDGYLLPSSILEIYQRGHQNDVPILVGWNDRDVLMGATAPRDAFLENIRNRFGEEADDFLKVYPTDTDAESAQSQFDMNRDETFGVQVYAWGKMHERTGTQPIYMYNFNRSLPAHSPETQFGAFHSGEIVYAYDNLHTLDRPWEEVDNTIADAMSNYWASFIKDGDPNVNGQPEWKSFSGDEPWVLSIAQQSKSEILPTKDKLNFWEQYMTK